MRRALAAPAALLILLTLSPSAQAQAADPAACPVIVAHATLKLDRPENTIAGIIAAGTTGADAVEMDVQWSSSGFPVLMHDATVDRTTNGTGSPSTLGLSQLRALSAADYAPWATSAFGGFNTNGTPKAPVPYGWEFMDAVKDADLDAVLDIHATPTEVGMTKLAAYITSFGWAARTLIMGPPDWVVLMRGWQPGFQYAAIEYNATTTIRRGESIQGTGAAAYVVPARDVTGPAVAYWHAYGLEVQSWASDTPAIDVAATWTQLATAGVESITTNQPAAARAVLCSVIPTVTPTTEPVPTTPPATLPATPPQPSN